MKCACLSLFGGFLFSRGRVSPRRATHFLCFAKESKQRKATPTVCVPSLRYGQPAVLDSGGGPQNSLRSNSCGPDPASICAPRRIQKGWERAAFAPARPQYQYQQSIPTTGAPRAAVVWWPSEAKARSVSKPLCMRRGAQGFADQGSQLSERSEFCETPRNPSTAGCPQRSGGSQTVGSPFFCLRFFGEAKKSRSPAGATPGLGKQTISTDRKIGSNRKAASPHPNPLPEGEGVSQK
ncbi:hypothetical protein SAMN05444748_113171 [Variovorax sp. OV700]|nr:hypothetical protein SAMN05444748_113171 [Variovorax sp. OV700]